MLKNKCLACFPQENQIYFSISIIFKIISISSIPLSSIIIIILLFDSIILFIAFINIISIASIYLLINSIFIYSFLIISSITLFITLTFLVVLDVFYIGNWYFGKSWTPFNFQIDIYWMAGFHWIFKFLLWFVGLGVLQFSHFLKFFNFLNWYLCMAGRSSILELVFRAWLGSPSFDSL